ncbi:MAG: ATP-binding protein [Anaerolineae bacterium]
MGLDLRLYLLGPFRMERAGEPVTDFKSNKVRALLAYLAVERQHPHHRDVLAGLLWPESSTTSALALLRDALSNLRGLLGDRDAARPYIAVLQDTLQFQLHESGWLDVAALTAATAPHADVSALKRATDLYRGDFMAGFSLTGAPEFESWALLQREVYRRSLQQALYRLATHYLQEGDYAAAQAIAQQQLRLDPYAEEAHRQLLRALALSGRRNQALMHYGEYRARLDEELGVAPDIRTAALYRRISDHRLTPPPAPFERGDASQIDSLHCVGRDAELARLESALRKAQRGEGQILLISGEAGSGKTLLMRTFIHRNVGATEETVAAWGTCNAQVSKGDPYLPFREILRFLTGDFTTSALDERLTPALAQRLENLTPEVMAALRTYGPDLSNSLLSSSERLPTMKAKTPRTPPLPAALCDQVARVLDAVARRAPLVLALDDLHWADESTLNLLAYLGRRLRESHILLLGSYRSAEASPALLQTVRELQRRQGEVILDLDRAAGRTFINAFLDSTPNALGPAFREQLYRQTGGHALFTVALVQQLRAEGALRRDSEGKWVAQEDLDWYYLPPQVEAVIAARVARLPKPLQALLTVASVEGEAFTVEVASQALEVSIDTVRRALSDRIASGYLVVAQGWERVGTQRVARYRFRHSLFQQYLYDRLDPVQRGQWHEAVGRALEIYYADRPEAAVRLAYHFEAAGLLEEAVAYLTRAGAHAYRLSAPAEAVKLYRRGLALLEQPPKSTARDRLELALQKELDMPLFAAQGWGAPARVAALERAHVLAQRLEATPQLLSILRSLIDVKTAQAQHQEALAYAERLAGLAQRVEDEVYMVLSHRTLGVSHFFLGHYSEARTHLEKGVAHYDALVQSTSDPSALPDVGEVVFLWAWLPHTLFALGYSQQAIAHSRDALARVREQAHLHPQTEAKMLTAAGAAFYSACRQPKATLRCAEDLLHLATMHHLPAFQGWARFYRGWGRAALGERGAGLAEMEAGWRRLREMGTQASLAQLFTLLAEAYFNAGQNQRSLQILTQALQQAKETHAHAYLAEMYRLRGELCPENVGEAQSWFLRAIDVARAQHARLWELRATVSLARLWQAQGRAAEGRDRLATVYGWFTEGFETPDLIAAREQLRC